MLRKNWTPKRARIIAIAPVRVLFVVFVLPTLLFVIAHTARAEHGPLPAGEAAYARMLAGKLTEAFAGEPATIVTPANVGSATALARKLGVSEEQAAAVDRPQATLEALPLKNLSQVATGPADSLARMNERTSNGGAGQGGSSLAEKLARILGE